MGITLPKMAPPSVSECGAKNQDKTFHLTPINVGNLVSPLLLNLFILRSPQTQLFFVSAMKLANFWNFSKN